jgi:uncharacterized protein (TIGR02599 family)
LLELLVAMSVLLLILGIVFRIIQGTTETWRSTTGKTEGFRGARTAFEAMTRTLSQATLNTYFDYADSSGNYRNPANPGAFQPAEYIRRSDLHFVTGSNLVNGPVQNPLTHAVFFQAPLGYTEAGGYTGMEGLLNATGFYLFYGPDPAQPDYLNSANLTAKNRFRLMQFLQPAEELSIGDSSVTGGSPNWNANTWFTTALADDEAPISQLAENVVALVILPKLSKADEAAGASTISTDYAYNSRDRAKTATLHQLPPVLQIAMVVIDEASAAKLGNTPNPPDFGVGGLFKDPAKLQDDLATLGRNLGAESGNSSGNAIPLRYEIFQTEVALRGAKWSKD